MEDQIIFADRQEFRDWLSKNHNVNRGVWLVFSKTDKLKTLTAREALEEALCFGWIDGLIKRVDEEKYVKKFSPRTKDSPWSEINRKLAVKLMECGKMSVPGHAAIEHAKKRGAWDAPPRLRPTDDDVKVLVEALQGEDLALANLTKMQPSIRRSYAGFYLENKKEEVRRARLNRLIERLKANKKPMD